MNVSDKQLAADYSTLHWLLQTAFPPPWSTPLVIGPDADLMGDFKSILAAHPAINVSTFHSSPFFPTCTIEDLLRPSTPRLILAKFNEFLPSKRRYAPQTDLWLGEGATDESERKPNNCTGMHFAAGFTYLEMLGIAAQQGIKVFMR